MHAYETLIGWVKCLKAVSLPSQHSSFMFLLFLISNHSVKKLQDMQQLWFIPSDRQPLKSLNHPCHCPAPRIYPGPCPAPRIYPETDNLSGTWTHPVSLSCLQDLERSIPTTCQACLLGQEPNYKDCISLLNRQYLPRKIPNLNLFHVLFKILCFAWIVFQVQVTLD